MKSQKIYTKNGDQGDTCLVSGESVPKSHIRLESYGTLDELNSCLGLSISFLNESPHSKVLKESLDGTLFKIQNDLFNLGSQLACVDPKISEKLPQIHQNAITEMESKIDELTEKLPALTNFILPGGGKLSASFHMARTICRRAERIAIALREESSLPNLCVPYLNRLSDLLFVCARFSNKVEGHPEILWKKV